MAFHLFQYFLMFIVPGLIGALAFNIATRFRTEIQWTTAFIMSLLTFTTMITGLYFFHNVHTVTEFIKELNCLSFTRRYILLSSLITIIYGVVLGLLRRLFFWIRK